MYVCMYVCMYRCIHVCMYACMYVCMYVACGPYKPSERSFVFKVELGIAEALLNLDEAQRRAFKVYADARNVGNRNHLVTGRGSRLALAWDNPFSYENPESHVVCKHTVHLVM